MSGPGGLTRRLREAYYGSPIHAWRIGGPGPEDLAVKVTDAWPGDAEAGREILEGAFSVAGQVMHVGADPWAAEGVTPAAAEMLHRFEWLRDLRDLGGDAARRRARDLVAGWLERFDSWDRAAWRSEILSTRLASWVGTFGFFAESADDAFHQAVLDSLARQYRHLDRTLGDARPGIGRIETIRGAVVAAVALGRPAGELSGLSDRLQAELDVQLFADGGHRSRSPAAQVATLSALVDVRAALRAAGTEPPSGLDESIARVTAALRMLRHGDGGLALFNGAVEGAVWRVDALLARTESKARALGSAPETGFERLVAGRTVLVMDTGVPSRVDGVAHAGTLSFEMSVGKERLIVNCGSAPADPRWETPLKASAAHSTLIVDDTNSTEIRSDGSIGRHPAAVRSERWEADGAVWVEAEHDGYVASHGLTHQRRVYLGAGGDDVRGEDVLTYSGAPGERAREAAIRFHLHPRVSASLIQNGASVLLRTASGSGWRLRSGAGALSLNESVYFGDRGQMQRSRQIVLQVPLAGIRDSGTVAVKWALRREDRRAS